MATFKALVVPNEKRRDGTYLLKIRITHNRKSKLIPTHIYLSATELTKSFQIKNRHIREQIDDRIRLWRAIVNKAGVQVMDMDVHELAVYINNIEHNKDGFRLNFIEYGRKIVTQKSMGTARVYNVALNALQRFAKSDFDVRMLTVSFLKEFEQFLRHEPKPGRAEKSKAEGASISSYMTRIRHILNEAKNEYNDEESGVINIPQSPFKKYKIKPYPLPLKKAASVDTIKEIILLPDGKPLRDLARDCFLCSFGLAGMNIADMFTCLPAQDRVLTYYRQKTRNRRADRAEMNIRIEPCIMPLMEKYRDEKQERMFSFYSHYATKETLQTAIQRGMKMIEEAIKPTRHITFYSARHSWATIARSSLLNIDKYTVHEALNHTDHKMKITDIYVERDWTTIWEANKRVLGLFDWNNSV